MKCFRQQNPYSKFAGPATGATKWGRFIRLGGLFLLLTGAAHAAEQLIFLKSGERLRGEVLKDSNTESLFISSKMLGVITVPRSAVEKMEAITPSPAKVAVQQAVTPAPDLSKEQDAQLAVAKATAEKLIENLENLETAKEKTEVIEPAPKPEESGENHQMADSNPDAQEAESSETNESDAQTNEEKKALAAALVSAEKLLDTVRTLEAPKSWKGNLRLGLNLYEGDTQEWTETYLRGKLEIQPEKSPSFYRLEGSYTYRETNPENRDPYKSTDKYDATFTYRRSFAEDWFLQNTLGWRVDQIKGIDREVQELLGVGYKYKWQEKLELIVGAGGGVEDYQTVYDDTRVGQSPVVNFFQELSWDLMERTELTQQFNYYSNPEESQDYNYVFKAGLRFRFSDLLGLEFSYNKEFEGDIGNGESRRDTQIRNSLIVFF